jgi:hypothetical protein
MVVGFEDKQEISWFVDGDNHDDNFGFGDELHDDLGNYWIDP